MAQKMKRKRRLNYHVDRDRIKGKSWKDKKYQDVRSVDCMRWTEKNTKIGLRQNKVMFRNSMWSEEGECGAGKEEGKGAVWSESGE